MDEKKENVMKDKRKGRGGGDAIERLLRVFTLPPLYRDDALSQFLQGGCGVGLPFRLFASLPLRPKG